MTYFDYKEFLCKCGRPECDSLKVINPNLLDHLNILRELLKRPLLITSGLRCEFWNEKEGGVPDSEHLVGDAADIQCTTSKERFDIVRFSWRAGFKRVGIGKTFIHLDVSPTKTPEVLWLYP